MKNATRYRKTTTVLISFAAVALILGRNLSLYKLEEILICWLFFSAAFVSLVLIILAGIFAVSGDNVSAKRTPSCKGLRGVAMLRHDQALKEGVDEMAKAGL